MLSVKKKISILLVLFSGLCFGHSSVNLQQTMYALYKNSDTRDQIIQFFQSAADKFQASGEEVLKFFVGLTNSEIVSVDFESYQEFEEWVAKQHKALLFLHEQDSVQSCAFHDFLQNLIKTNKSQQVDVVKMSLVAFVRKVAVNKDAIIDNPDIVPNVLFIDQGQVRELSTEDLLINLKQAIEEFFSSVE